jgi:hypothetical protein
MAKARKSFDNRGAVVKRLRVRDGDVCWLCQTRSLFLPERSTILGIATIDHVLPVSMGGSNDDENLRLSHLLCNNIRGTSIDADEIRARIATLFDDDGNAPPRVRRRQLLRQAARQESRAQKDTVYPFCAWPRMHVAAWPVVDERGNLTLSATKPDHLS